jgi:multidrug efflux pump subunit AcrA (membrane-fusion protein)
MRDSRKKRTTTWVVLALLATAGGYAALRVYAPGGVVAVPTARVERKEFLVTVRARGEVKSDRSVRVTAPRTPNLQIVRLAETGRPIKRGDVVVEFDSATQEERYLEQETQVRQVESEIIQAKAQHSITDEQNSMVVMQSEYNLERAKLEAGKQEILSEIQGLKNRIDVDVSQGELKRAETTVEATGISQQADLTRLGERRAKSVRDLDRTKGYLGNMVVRAPADGVVNILTNSRAQGSFGQSRPPFQEGDTVWAGAEIAEIPDLSSLSVEFRVEEIDRGRAEVGQPVRMRIDAVPDVLLEGTIKTLSPIATLVFRRFPPEKNFPAVATIEKLDPRLRPGMSVSVEIIVESRPGALVIPAKASFQIDGQPTVFVVQGSGFRPQPIEVLARNSTEIVISDVLEEGQVIALENPLLAGAQNKP